jgi:hypothetical protein
MAILTISRPKKETQPTLKIITNKVIRHLKRDSVLHLPYLTSTTNLCQILTELANSSLSPTSLIMGLRMTTSKKKVKRSSVIQIQMDSPFTAALKGPLKTFTLCLKVQYYSVKTLVTLHVLTQSS